MGGETVTEYRLRLRNGVVTPASLRPREGEMYYGRTAREQIEMMAKTERDYRNDPALVTIQVSRDGGESWETVEEAPAPDRSVDVLVAEAVKSGAGAIAERRTHDELDEATWNAYLADARAGLTAAGFPALVEALADAVAAMDVLLDGAALHNSRPGARLLPDGVSDGVAAVAVARPRARAALGGVRVDGRAELEAELGILRGLVISLAANRGLDIDVWPTRSLKRSGRWPSWWL